MKKNPLVSIVTPCYKDKRTIGWVINAVKKQTYVNYEYLILDQSPDETPKIIKKHIGKNKKIKLIHDKQRLGLGKTINKGFKIAKGEIYVVLHGDCVPTDKNWLRNLVQPIIDDKKVGGTMSVVIPKETENFSLADKLFLPIYNPVYSHMPKKPTDLGINFSDKADAYCAKLYDNSGGFDQKVFFSAGEDRDLTNKFWKKGYKVMLCPKSKVHHMMSAHQRGGFFKHFRKMKDYSRVEPMLHKRHLKERRETGSAAPFFIFLTLLITSLAYFIPSLIYLAYAVLVGASFIYLRIAKIGVILIVIGLISSYIFTYFGLVCCPTLFNILFFGIVIGIILQGIAWGVKYGLKTKRYSLLFIGLFILVIREIFRTIGYAEGLPKIFKYK